jgi:hypothetical protein
MAQMLRRRCRAHSGGKPGVLDLLERRWERKQGRLRRGGIEEEDRSVVTRVVYATWSAPGRSLRMRVKYSISMAVSFAHDMVDEGDVARRLRPTCNSSECFMY